MTSREASPLAERRPLTARSVIASTLLGVVPPRLPALALVRSGELFGLREGATRTALSRMAAAGEVVADDGHYELAGPLLERHARQQSARQRSASRSSGQDWDGTWIAAVVTVERRSAADRAAFRAAAAHRKLAEVREGFWTRPDDRVADTAADEARRVLDPQVTWLRGIRPDDPAPLVAAFETERWAAGARELLAAMAEWQSALDEARTEVLGDTFVLAAAVLRHLVADPSLPTSLLRDDWPGEELRSAFDRFDTAFKATWRAWYRAFRAG